MWIAAEADGVRKHAPATLRNRMAIADVLRGVLPLSGTVLEVASGSGEHAAYFAGEFPALDWQPSDADAGALASIAAWCDGTANVAPPLMLDAVASVWPVAHADAIVCVNMAHISPWASTLGLLAGARRVLSADAPLVLYGPFRQAGVPLAQGNAAFDQSLRARNPAWGLRTVEHVSEAASDLALEQVIPMAADNLTLVFRRR